MPSDFVDFWADVFIFSHSAVWFTVFIVMYYNWSCGPCWLPYHSNISSLFTCNRHPSGYWSTAPHAVVLTLMREHYRCVYL